MDRRETRPPAPTPAAGARPPSDRGDGDDEMAIIRANRRRAVTICLVPALVLGLIVAAVAAVV
ncbi:MAG: hypothetical protein ACLQPH_14510, partial [Acidimicrobiales bacterium]